MPSTRSIVPLSVACATNPSTALSVCCLLGHCPLCPMDLESASSYARRTAAPHPLSPKTRGAAPTYAHPTRLAPWRDIADIRTGSAESSVTFARVDREPTKPLGLRDC